MSKSPNRGKGSRERAASRRVQALQLAQTGHSFREIASLTGVSCTQAHKDVHASLAELKTVEIGEAEKLRDLELSRVDRLWKAASRKAERGNLGAIAVSIRLSEHRCDLLGLTGKRIAAAGGSGEPAPAPVPQVSVTVINQQTIIQIQEVMGVAREHGLLDRLLSLPQVQRVEIEGPKIEGQHAGNGNGLHAGDGHRHPS